jgi:hypothetical protein
MAFLSVVHFLTGSHINHVETQKVVRAQDEIVRVRVFDINLHFRGCHFRSHACSLELKLLHACDQWYFSRVFTCLIGWIVIPAQTLKVLERADARGQYLGVSRERLRPKQEASEHTSAEGDGWFCFPNAHEVSASVNKASFVLRKYRHRDSFEPRIPAVGSLEARCAFHVSILHSRMPLDSIPVCLKRTCV